MQEMTQGIILQNITKKYGKIEVLKNINLNIKEGEFVVMVGPSGCGKSTLLSIISGLETKFSGDIFYNQKKITHTSPRKRDVAMVFQSYALYPNMTVRENIAFGLENRAIKKQEIKQVVEEVAKSLQIENFLERKPAQLSGGQRQRVAMGRAISRKPKLFLFDEPLSNLDANLRAEMRQEIKLLHQRLNTTVIYVTHDQTEAMTLADKIAVLKNGNIEQVGSPEEVYYQPDNLFVASFIGMPPINLIPVTLKKQGTSLSFTITNDENKAFAFTIKNKKLLAYANQEVVLGIRPENLEKIEDNKTLFPKEKVIEAKINFIENTGTDNYIFIKLNNKNAIARSYLKKKSVKNQEIKINFLLSKAIFFDSKTGKRI